MGWVLNQCKAEEEAGGRRGRAVELLEKPGQDLYRRMNLEPFNHLTAVQILSISLNSSQIHDPSLFELEMELGLPVHTPHLNHPEVAILVWLFQGVRANSDIRHG